MNTKQLYAIRDRVAAALVGNSMYLVFAFRTNEEATRYFADAILDEKSILAKHPRDYELVQVGVLEDTPAGEVIRADGSHRCIATGEAIVALNTPRLVEKEA